jgi:putative transposase
LGASAEPQGLRAKLEGTWGSGQAEQLPDPDSHCYFHTDPESQCTSRDWAAFLRAHNLEHSMSRRGNCHDNAVAESLFNLLKRERAKRKTYKTQEQARQDIFDYIKMFYNPKRKHARNDMMSPPLEHF